MLMAKLPAESAGRMPAATRRVLIVEDEFFIGDHLRKLLEQLGHEVVGQATTGEEAVKMFTDQRPDLLLVDIRLEPPDADHSAPHTVSGGDGIALVALLLSERRCPALIISAYGDQQLIERASAAGVFGYLLKPVSSDALAAQIAVAVQRFNDTEKLRTENATLQQTLEERKIVEKAKGILMRRLNLPEPDAHKKLQQECQKRRMSMCELAKRIIDSDEVMGA